jgi:integrase
MEIPELVQDPLVVEWFSITEIEPNTRKIFLQSLRYFTEFVKKSPSELITEAEAEIESGLLMRKRKIKGYFLTFREWLKREGFAPKSVATHLAAIKSFYRSFDIDIPVIGNKKAFRPTVTVNGTARLERDQIKEVLKYANVRNKAIILVGASSGLAAADILNLKIEDFKRGQDSKTLVTTLRLRRIKTKTDFITFLSPEATLAVQDYLDYRNRKPVVEQPSSMDAWKKRCIRADTDYLFVRTDIPNEYLVTLKEEDRRLNNSGFMDIFRELAKKVGLESKKGEWQLVRAHNLRKYFNSTLLNNGCEFFLTEFWMGHKLGGTQSAYFQSDPETLKEKYIRFIPYLSLTDTEVHTVESHEYQKLKADYENLKTDIEEMRQAFGMVRTPEGNFTFSAELRELPEEHPLAKKGKSAVITSDKLDGDNNP